VILNTDYIEAIVYITKTVTHSILVRYSVNLLPLCPMNSLFRPSPAVSESLLDLYKGKNVLIPANQVNLSVPFSIVLGDDLISLSTQEFVGFEFTLMSLCLVV